MGDDTTNQIISEVDQYGREYPAMFFNYATQQYLPQNVADLRNITTDEITKQIEYLKNESIPAAYAKSLASNQAYQKELARHERETTKQNNYYQAPDLEFEKTKEAYKADSQALEKLTQELKNYEQSISLKREIDAYNSLSDEDKAILGDYIFNYGVFWKYGDYLTGGPDALTDAEKNAYQKSKQEKEQRISRLQQKDVYKRQPCGLISL